MIRARHRGSCCLFALLPLFCWLAFAHGDQEEPTGPFGLRAAGTTGNGTREGSAFAFGAGAGPAFVKGSIGTAPQVELSGLGIGAGAGYHLFVSFLRRLQGGEVRLAGECLRFLLSGDASYSGAEWTSAAVLPSPPQMYYGMVQGDPVDATLAMNLAVVSADWLFGFGEILGAGTLKAGPRLRWLGYYDEFIINNHGGTPFAPASVTLPCEYKTSRGYTMLGMGLAGSLDGGSIALGPLAQIAHRVVFAGVLGAGNGMRFGSAEGFLEFMLARPTLPRLAGDARPLSTGLAVQVGYVSINLVETRDEGSFPGTGAAAPGFPGPPQTNKAQYWISYPEVRIGLVF